MKSHTAGGREDDRDWLEQLLTPEEVSELTLATWRRRGGGPPFVKTSRNRRVHYRRGSVLAWIRAREQISTADCKPGLDAGAAAAVFF